MFFFGGGGAHFDPHHWLLCSAFFETVQAGCDGSTICVCLKPSKMMFNLGFHKSVLKAKQIKKANLLVCLVFFLSLFLVFFFFFTRSQYSNNPGRIDKIPTTGI